MAISGQNKKIKIQKATASQKAFEAFYSAAAIWIFVAFLASLIQPLG